jgi:hypothetical protein
MREILHSPFFLVTVDDEARLVKRVRTSARFQSLEQVERTYAELIRVMSRVEPTYAQLIDARESPARNDPAFESVVARHHAQLYSGFRAVAVLVQTAVGRLQVRRMLDASGIGAPVFTDENEALAYLASTAGAGGASAGPSVAASSTGSRRPPST